MCDCRMKHRDVQNPFLQLLGEELYECVLQPNGSQTVTSEFAS